MLPAEIAKFISEVRDVSIFEVEKGAIKRFADAIDDPNLLYGNEEYANGSKYGSIVAPPGFFGWPLKGCAESLPSLAIMEDLIVALAKAGYSRLLDGSIEYEFGCPVRAGDTLVASSMIKDVIERGGKMGKTLFIITETSYTNQNGDWVAKVQSISLAPSR